MPSLVALSLPGGPRFVDELKRAWDAGHAVLPLDVRQPASRQVAVARRMGASSLIDAQGPRPLDGARPTEPGDALVVLTSGTTGQPKGAVLTMAAVEASARLTNAALGVVQAVHWLACLPLVHIGGLAVITRALTGGTALTAVPSPDAAAITAALDAGATHVSLVPAVLDRADSSRFTKILLGGGPMPAGMPANAVSTYGMTETGSGVVYDGIPLPGVEVVADAAQRLHVRSPTLMRCYRNGEAGVSDDGWFATGDAGHVDTTGRVTVHGRADDVIITGGEKVWPVDVERVLRTHPSVSDVLVHGEPDPKWGEVVIAVVELAPGTDLPPLGVLQDHVRAHLPAHYVPRRVTAVTSLPRTPSGKVIRQRKV